MKLASIFLLIGAFVAYAAGLNVYVLGDLLIPFALGAFVLSFFIFNFAKGKPNWRVVTTSLSLIALAALVTTTVLLVNHKSCNILTQVQTCDTAKEARYFAISGILFTVCLALQYYRKFVIVK